MNMKSLYQYTGMLVVWGFFIVIAILIVCIIWDACSNVSGKNWFHYYIQRTVISTDVLRHNYMVYHKYRVHKYWMLKYILRNIRMAKP